MSKSGKASVKELEICISCLNEVLEETKKTFVRFNKEGKMNDVIEEIEAYRKELEPIKLKLKKAKNENKLKGIVEEMKLIENNIKADMVINIMKREIIEQLKATKNKWEITIDVMMIIGKYFKSSKDYVNIMKVCKRYINWLECITSIQLIILHYLKIWKQIII